MNRAALLAVLCLASSAPRARAEGEGGGSDATQLTRDESTAYKRKLQAILAAMGLPPEGYGKSEEHYTLPTNFAQLGKTSTYYPQMGRAELTYGIAVAADAQKKSQDSQIDLQGKIMAAQAAGDYAAMSQLSQQMSQQVGQMQMLAMNAASKPTIRVTLNANASGGGSIDPDLVLYDKPGMIALKQSDQDPETLNVYFDPVALKDPKMISSLNLHQLDQGVPSKVAIASVQITLAGPKALVEAWAQKIDAAKVLALIKAN